MRLAGAATFAAIVRRRRILLGAAIAVLVVVFTVIGVVGYMIGSKTSSTPARRPGPLPDGTYRMDYDAQKATLNGHPHPPLSTNNVMWLAIRSSCTSAGCFATATELDSNHQAARTPLLTTIFRLINGHWQSMPNRHQQPQQNCFDVKGGTKDPGADTETTTSLLEPQPDGTLRGNETTTVLTNECGYEGEVFTMPVTAARVSDVPAGVTMGDPAKVTVAPTTSSPAPVAGGPALDGTYRLDYDYEKTTLNDAPSPGPNKAYWWAFRSLCTSAGCVATSARLDDTIHQVAAGTVHVLHFAENAWQYASAPMEIFCSNANQTITATESDSWSLDPQPDGTLKGVETIHVETNECGTQGTIRTPFVATRIGDVPTSVIVADPALFKS